MTFRERLPYFLGGLTIGIIVVVFFLGKKETTFDYGPNARVLKNIRVKKHLYSDESQEVLNLKRIDSTQIAEILKNGNVDIWNKIKIDSCMQYNITGSKDLKNITLTVVNCEFIATIKNIIIE